MQNDVIFRYKNGRIIPIKVKQEQTTNDYMNDKIRGNGKRKNENKQYNIPKKIIKDVYSRKTDEYDDYNFYITEISPDDYLKLTTSPTVGTSIEAIQEEVKSGKYATDALTATNKGYIMLEMNMNTGEVIKHDGRHRMIGLKQAGYEKAQILVFPVWDNYQGFKQQSYRTVKNQYGDGFSTYFEQMIPVNKQYMEQLNKKE